MLKYVQLVDLILCMLRKRYVGSEAAFDVRCSDFEYELVTKRTSSS